MVNTGTLGRTEGMGHTEAAQEDMGVEKKMHGSPNQPNTITPQGQEKEERKRHLNSGRKVEKNNSRLL